MANRFFKYIFLAFTVLLLCNSAVAQTTDSDFTAGELAYKFISDDAVSVLGYKENATIDKRLVIPDTVVYEDKIYKVEAIEANAFLDANINDLKISANIISIGECAFKGAQFIYLYLPNSLQSIGQNCFENCTKLREIRTPGNSLTAIPENAFRGCIALTSPPLNPSQLSPHPSTYFIIGPAVTEIASNAFYGCESLVSVTVPDNVELIGTSAFGNCTKLQRIVLGTNVSTLGSDIFSGCPVLKEIIIKGNDLIEPYRNIISGATVYVDEDLIDRYQENVVWENNTFLPALPLSLSLTYDGEDVPDVISLPLDQKITLNAKMLGQELLGANASDQPVHYWTSSNNDVASISANGIVTGVGLGTTNITVSTTFDFKPYSRTCEIAVGYDNPTAVKITAPEKLMSLGTTLTLSAEVIPSGALQQFTWSCLTPNYASISESGVITPKAVGRAIFKATSSANPNVFGTVTIDIHYAKATSIDLNIESDTLRIADTAQFSCFVNPYPYASQSVQWFTSNENVATVSQTGFIECVGLGKVIISAMSTEANHIVGTKELYVDYSIPTHMIISTPQLDMKVGDVRQIQFTIEPAGAEQRAEWVSEDEDVATVDADGNVTAVGVGTTVISGTTGSVKASCVVTVDYADPVRVVLNYTGVNVNIGDSVQLVARILPIGARQDITWTIDNDTIATIDQDGWVFGLEKGATHILAKATAKPSIWGGCNVIVIEQDIDAINDIPSVIFSTEVIGSSIIISGLDPAEIIEVYDLTGTCVFRTSAPSSGIVSTGTLRKGIYIVRARRNSVKVKI